MSGAAGATTLATTPTRSAARARGWLRATAVVLALFALGHTLGTAAARVTRGATEGAVFAAMQRRRRCWRKAKLMSAGCAGCPLPR
jgi:hypothetical protein